MKLFVAGGTGAVGCSVVPALVAAGHDVSVLARSPAKAAQVKAQGARPSNADLFDRATLAAAVAGCQGVVNLATNIPALNQMGRPEAWGQNDRIRTEASANLVEAALGAGAGRFVQESIAFAYPDRGEGWIDEDTPLDAAGPTRSVAAAEANARRFAQARPGNVAVVLRFGWFYGPASETSRAMIDAARGEAGPWFGPRDHWVASLHLDDAATAVVAALAAPGGSYHVTDEPVTWGDFAEALGEAVGGAPWLRVSDGSATRFGEGMGVLGRSQRVSSRRFRTATGWAPRYGSVREGWPAVVRALEQERG